MNIEDKPVERGQILFYLVQCAKKPTYRNCQVLDVNEHVKAVKVSYAQGSKGGIRHDWIPASMLRRSDPTKETQPF